MPEDVYLKSPKPGKPKPNQPIEVDSFEEGVSKPGDEEATPLKPAAPAGP